MGSFCFLPLIELQSQRHASGCVIVCVCVCTGEWVRMFTCVMNVHCCIFYFVYVWCLGVHVCACFLVVACKDVDMCAVCLCEYVCRMYIKAA